MKIIAETNCLTGETIVYELEDEDVPAETE